MPKFSHEGGAELHKHMAALELQKQRQECLMSSDHKSQECKQLGRLLRKAAVQHLL